jgi:hypothetical protein
VISPGPIPTKGHNSDLPISPTSLAEIGTDQHKYLLTTQYITAVITDTQEIPMCSWTPSSYFCRAYCRTLAASINYMLVPPRSQNLGEAMLNSFIVGPLVSNPK